MGANKKRRKMPPEIAEATKRRSGHNCEVRSSPLCTGNGEELHHRQLRSQGGEDLVVNLVHICGHCHRWIHRHVKLSQARGYIVKSYGDPELAPILLPTRFFGRRWQLLSEDGHLFPTPAPDDYDEEA